MQSLSAFYQSIFGCKTYKISLDSGCTCPNRDGTKGRGGCIFCSENGSGDFVAARSLSIREQVEQGKKKVEAKLRGRSGQRQGKYIAYFQSFTSTYGKPSELLKKYREALDCEGIVGLAVATRPDCLGEEVLAALAEISKTHFVQIELGLQTGNEETGQVINRCYTDKDYTDAVSRIRKTAPAIHIVTHLIFGLPGETEKDMLNSVSFVVQTNENASHFELDSASNAERPGLSRDDKWGLKITSLYVLKNTRLAAMYEAGDYQPMTKEDYFELLKKALSLLPENCVVHRLTGDPPKRELLAPAWPTDKKRILNDIRALLSTFGTLYPS